METARLEQIANEMGTSLDEARETQLDSESLTTWQKIKRVAKNTIGNRMTWLLASPVIVAGALAGAGYLTTAQVRPLGWYDFDGDGKKDAAVVFPNAFGEVGTFGYISGDRVPSSALSKNADGSMMNIPFVTNRLFFHQVGNVDLPNRYNNPLIAGSNRGLELYNHEGHYMGRADGKIDEKAYFLAVYVSGNGRGGVTAKIADIHGTQESYSHLGPNRDEALVDALRTKNRKK